QTLQTQVEDLLARPNVLFGIAMTVETPVHVQRLHLPGQRHAIDPAMTAHTADSLVHVNTVIELHEIRQLVNANPLDRLPVPVTGTYRFEHRASYPELRVAVHARLRRRHPGKGGILNGGVTVTAVDAKLAGMM